MIYEDLFTFQWDWKNKVHTNKERVDFLFETIYIIAEHYEKELDNLQNRLYALEVKPKFKRGDKVSVIYNDPPTELKTAIILRHVGVLHGEHAYDLDLNGKETLLDIVESQLRSTSPREYY